MLTISVQELEHQMPSLLEKKLYAKLEGGAEVIQEIVDGVAITLENEFGEEYEIYQYDAKQGLSTPCFLILLLEPSRRRQIGRRWRQDTPLDIQYFPAQDGDNQELVRVADRLFSTLEFIILQSGEQMHGYDMRTETVDGVLHFFVQYNAFLTRPNDVQRMEELDVQTTTKEG